MSVTERRAERAHEGLRTRLAVAADILRHADAAAGRLPDDVVDGLGGVVGRAGERLGHGSSHTVVALAGATGSGKSSLFNELLGEPVARVGVRRPTTSVTQAGVFDADDDATSLLDWLSIQQRHVVTPDRARPLSGLVLLDLPDHDSTAAAHREEVDRLVEVVDAFVWVVDPQKYADMALHHRYLRRFAGHGAVTMVVLNQIDLVPVGARRQVVDHLRALLREDGLHEVRVLATSTRTGEGLGDLRRELAARVAERRAVVARLDADLDLWSARLAEEVGDRPPRAGVDRASRDRLVQAFATAAGVDAVADAVGAAHRHRAAAHVGWPPTRWIARLRPDPLRRLGLDRVSPGRSAVSADGATTTARTSMPTPSVVATAQVATAVRRLAEEVGDQLPERWRRSVAGVAAARRDDVADALDRSVATTVLPTTTPRWWRWLSAVQVGLTAVMAAGLLWLLAIGVVAWFGLPDLPTPRLGRAPWPTVMALGGAVLGLVVSAVARSLAGVGARRRAATARRALRRSVAAAADELVLAPVQAELAALGELHHLARRLRR